MRKRVLFVCTHNAVRSQMAEGLVNHLLGGTYEAFSAGTRPAGVHPMAVEVMREIGVDISGQRSKPLERFVHEPFDYVVTVCDSAKQSCPTFPFASQTLHWNLPDPSTASGSLEERLAFFRRVRDELRELVIAAFGG